MDDYYTLLETNKPAYIEEEESGYISTVLGTIEEGRFVKDDVLHKDEVVVCTTLVSIYDLVSKWTMLTYSQRY